jgi:gluconolactonase
MSSTTPAFGTGLEPFEVLADGLDHPECVAWDPGAGVLYAGGEAGQIYAIGEDGELRQVADVGAFVLGLAVDGDGRVYACAGSRVVRVTPAAGTFEVFTAGADDEPLATPNYPAFGLDGTLYVTDSGEWDGDTGKIYRVLPGGATEVWTRALTSFPNGCCLSPEGDALLVVLSQAQEPGVWRVPIEADGSAGEPERVCALPGTIPDGVAYDADGRLYVSCYRPDRIYRVEVDGTVGLLADDPRGVTFASPTNIAFMGAGLGRLATSNLGRWHVSAGDVDATGHPIPRPSLG